MSDTVSGMDHAAVKVVDLAAFRRARGVQPALAVVKAAPVVLAGGASYHEEAIREADRTRRT